MNNVELRIGNLVYSGGSYYWISCGEDLDWLEFEPIPLTEEMLLKCGFKNNGQKIFDLDGWLPYLRQRTFEGNIYYQVMNVANCNIVYLHQLQNLYFALTGTELEINL